MVDVIALFTLFHAQRPYIRFRESREEGELH